MFAMAQDSDSPLETLDSSLSHTDRITIDHHQSSSSSSATTSSLSSDRALSRNSSLSRLNAQAPEFVPRSSSSSPSSPSLPRPDLAQAGLVHVYPGPNPGFRLPIHGAPMAVPVQTHHPYPHHVPVQYHHQQRHRPQYYGGGPVDHHHEVAVQAQQQAPAEPDHAPTLRNGVSEEAAQKIINQVEYYFSDLNLATTDHLMRFINKDAEGYVPISVVASFKKIKALISSNSQLASILRDSAKLVVSEDGKKVKRQHPLTELDMEELQSRIVVAENLPEDHCHQNLMKVFSAVGSVKTIRTCQPQTSNGGASSASRSGKADNMLFSNKLHAFVEYESVELADKAVAELNDEANWRSGLRVRLFVRHTGKSAQPRGKKFENEVEVNGEEDDTSSLLRPQMNEKNLEDPSQQFDGQSREHTVQGEEHINDRESGQKKGRTRGRGKGRGGRPQSQYHLHHNHHHQNNQRASCHVVGTPPLEQQPSLISKQPPGPRMPDGTRGFSMGRGKPVVTVNITA